MANNNDNNSDDDHGVSHCNIISENDIVESKATLMMGMNNMLNDISNDNGGDDKDDYINNNIAGYESVIEGKGLKRKRVKVCF